MKKVFCLLLITTLLFCLLSCDYVPHAGGVEPEEYIPDAGLKENEKNDQIVDSDLSKEDNDEEILDEDKKTLSDYETWLNDLSAQKLAQIKCSQISACGPIGILNYHYYTSDPETMSNILNAYKQVVITELFGNEWAVGGGANFLVVFVTDEGREYTLEYFSSFYHAENAEGNQSYFRLEDIPWLALVSNCSVAHSFFTKEIAQMYASGDSSQTISINLNDAEFVAYYDHIPSGDPTHYIEADFGTVSVYSDGVFACMPYPYDTVRWFKLSNEKIFSDYAK